MSSNTIDTLVVKLMGDARGLKQVLMQAQKDAKTAAKYFETQARQAQQQHNSMLAEGARLTAAVAKPTERYANQLQHLNRMMHAGYITQQTYTRHLRQLRIEYERISPVLQRVASGFGRVGGMMRMGGFMASAAITAPLTAFAYSGVRAFTAFDKAMTYSLSIADNVTPELRKQMEDLAKTMSEQSAFSATELAEAYYELISAGLSAASSMKSLDTVNKFATAGGMDLASSTKQLVKAVASFGMQSEEAAKQGAAMALMANTLVQAANMTTASIQDMTQAFLNAAPQAKSAGMSLKELTALISYYQVVSSSAAEAGEHVAIGLRLIGTAYAQHKDFWKQQNVALYDATGNMRKFTEVIKDMQKVYMRLSSEGRADLLKKLGFEAMQQRALNPLLQNTQAVAMIEKFEKGLENENALMEVAGKQMQSFSNQTKMMYHALQNVSMEVAEIFLPYLKQGIAIVKLGVDYWKGLTAESKKLAVVFGIASAAIGPLLAFLGTLAAMAAIAISAVASLVTVVTAIGAPIAIAVAGVAALAAAVGAAAAAIVAFIFWPEQMADITSKTVRVAERIWDAFVGWMLNRWDHFWTVDFQLKLAIGIRKASEMLAQFAKSVGEFLSNPAVGVFKFVTAGGADRGTARQEGLGAAMSKIFREEFGGGSFGKKVQSQVAAADAKAKADMDMKELMKGMGAAATTGTGQLAEMGTKLDDVNKKYKEQIAIQKALAAHNYKFSNHQQEVMKLELELAKQRQDMIDKYIKEGLTVEDEKVKTALADLEKQTAAQLKLAHAQADELDVLDKQKEIYQWAEQHKSPAKKFAEDMDKANKAMAAGFIDSKQYAEVVRKLRKELTSALHIDFRIPSIEAQASHDAATRAHVEDFVRGHLASMQNVLAEPGASSNIRFPGGAPPLSRYQQLLERRHQKALAFAAEGKFAQRIFTRAGLPTNRFRSVQAADWFRQQQIARVNQAHSRAMAQAEARQGTTNAAQMLANAEIDKKKEDTDLLKRIAKATENTAKKKGLDLQPANL